MWPEWIAVFVIGVCIGSFFNVCIYRLPRGLSLVRPGSKCPKCGVKIRWWDNVPIMSFIVLRGKCRKCGCPISVEYPLVEVLTGICFLLLYIEFGPSLRLLSYGVFSSLLILAFFIDLHHKILPEVITLPGVASGILFSLAAGELRQSLLGCAVGAGTVRLIVHLGKFIFKREAMGLGDVALAAMVGAYLGWRLLLVTLFFSFLSGSVVGLILVASKKKGMASEIPFGPFIAGSALAVAFYGPELLQIYLRLYG